MENLNAEQIKKALECLQDEHNILCDTKCPYYDYSCKTYHCEIAVSRDALALITSQEQRIKELAEENEVMKRISDERGAEVLRHDNCIRELHNKITELESDNERLRAENEALAISEVKECEISQMFVYRIRDKHPAVMAIVADTVRKMQERLKMASHIESTITGYRYSVVDVVEIDQIAKEMLEGENEGQTNA